MAKLIGVVLTLLLLLIALAFSVQNAHPVHVDFFLGSYDAPLSFLLLLCVLCGFVIGILVILSSMLKLKMENVRLKRELKLSQSDAAVSLDVPVRDSKSHA